MYVLFCLVKYHVLPIWQLIPTGSRNLLTPVMERKGISQQNDVQVFPVFLTVKRSVAFRYYNIIKLPTDIANLQ